MNDKKYILFSAVGFNDPVGSVFSNRDIEYIKEKINNYYKDNKINKNKRDEIITYFDEKINKEEIYSEGSILSIVRKFKPERVMLFFTEDMFNRKYKDKSIIEIFKEEIPKRSEKCKDKNILIKNSNMIANSFDDDLIDNNSKAFKDMLKELKEGYEDYQVLINITSGTNQIKTKLALECIYSKDDLQAVYVSRQNIIKSVNNEEYEEDDEYYSYTEEIDPNYKNEYNEQKDNLNYLKHLYDEYEQVE